MDAYEGNDLLVMLKRINSTLLKQYSIFNQYNSMKTRLVKERKPENDNFDSSKSERLAMNLLLSIVVVFAVYFSAYFYNTFLVGIIMMIANSSIYQMFVSSAELLASIVLVIICFVSAFIVGAIFSYVIIKFATKFLVDLINLISGMTIKLLAIFLGLALLSFFPTIFSSVFGLSALVGSLISVFILRKAFIEKCKDRIHYLKENKYHSDVNFNERSVVHNAKVREELDNLLIQNQQNNEYFNQLLVGWYPASEKYRTDVAINFFIDAVSNKKADTIKECVNLYDQHLHNSEVQKQLKMQTIIQFTDVCLKANYYSKQNQLQESQTNSLQSLANSSNRNADSLNRIANRIGRY